MNIEIRGMFSRNRNRKTRYYDALWEWW